MKTTQITHFQCVCIREDHVLRFRFEPEPPRELEIAVCMNDFRPWYKRIWIAIHYMFGRRCSQSTDWDCVLLDDEQTRKLHSLLNDYLESDTTRMCGDVQ